MPVFQNKILQQVYCSHYIVLLVLSIFSFNNLHAQTISDTIEIEEEVKVVDKILEVFKRKDHVYNYNLFGQFVPTRDNPTVGFKTNYNGKESILFDVHPVLSLNLFSNFQKQLQKKNKGKFIFSQGYSFNFRPHFRLYSGESTPVKMPTYRFSLGLQHIYKFNAKHFFGYSIESGHYSNGQSGSAIIGGGADESAQSDSVWALVNDDTKLSEVINRSNGDFSTNLTEVLFNYRFVPFYDNYNKPKQIHSFTTGFQYYHNKFFGVANVGGYTPQSIAIYGHWRYLFSYAYNYNLKSGYRIVVNENIEVIGGAHPSVNPIRMETQATIYTPIALGIFISYSYGHDNYNLRFVDSGHQFGFGITWEVFAPILVGK